MMLNPHRAITVTAVIYVITVALILILACVI